MALTASVLMAHLSCQHALSVYSLFVCLFVCHTYGPYSFLEIKVGRSSAALNFAADTGRDTDWSQLERSWSPKWQMLLFVFKLIIAENVD